MAPRKRTGPATTPARSQRIAACEVPEPTIADRADIWRCWSLRACPYGCTYLDDCALADPLPVHTEPCSRGMLGAGGQWIPCCAECRAAS
jgi:hypothetical protein